MIPKKTLFSDIRELCDSGWHSLPNTGSGAPGDYLEQIPGLKTTNHDGPDAGLWELKFSRGTSLLTLFHKTPRPKGSMKFIINRFGWKGRNGRQSFRHTISGESDRGFNIACDAGSIRVRHADAMTILPRWTEDDLPSAAGGKLRRLIFVEGTVKKVGTEQLVMYEKATACQQFQLSRFMEAITTGLVLVDFDAYIKPGGAVRDHGTRFRVKFQDLHKLYDTTERIV